MKVMTTVKLDLSLLTISRHVRSDLAKEVEKYWLNKKSSNVALQYLRLNDGVIKAVRSGWERTDLLCFQLILPNHKWAGFNIFYEPNGYLTWNVFEGTEISQQEKTQVEQWIRAKVQEADLAAYLEHETVFLTRKPWQEVDGMTPAEAVAKFKELGWYEPNPHYTKEG